MNVFMFRYTGEESSKFVTYINAHDLIEGILEFKNYSRHLYCTLSENESN